MTFMKKITNDLQTINKDIQSNQEGFVLSVEKEYDGIISTVADRISTNPAQNKLIMLSGPSASGKTTSSRKLKQELINRGMQAITISLDDFFLPREEVPLLPNGKNDYESTAALNLPLLHKCLEELIDEGKTLLPSFDFKIGRASDEKVPVELHENGVAIVEGIHALSDTITEQLPKERLMKIYVSVVKSYLSDEKTVFLNRNVRLIRRLIRDYKFRSSSFENTFNMWPMVCKGESMYIKPFKAKADITIDSFMAYEMSVYKNFAIDKLQEIEKGSAFYDKANELIEAFNMFEPVDKKFIPNTSLIREFIGDSIYFGSHA